MRIGILSFYPSWQESSPEELRLVEAAAQQGYEAEIVRAVDCQMTFKGGSDILYRGESIPQFDAWIPRARIIGKAELHLAVVKELGLKGERLVNEYAPIVRAKNKLRTTQILTDAGVPVPNSVAVSSIEWLEAASEQLGGFPLIMKDPYGTYGKGVVLIESLQSGRSILQALTGYYPKPILLQEFVKESGGADTRVFVVGGKVVAAMERKAQGGDFRSNLELGGEARSVEVSSEQEQIALAAAKALNLEIAGVDLIQSSRGPLVLEVNANPGFKGLEASTGVDVAGAIIRYVVESSR